MGLFFKESPEERKAYISLLNNWTSEIPSEKLELDFDIFRKSMLYAEQNIIKSNEKVLSFIGADYLANHKIAGILVLTDSRLLYVHKDKKSQFKQEWLFNKINGIKESGFPLKINEFQLDVGKSKVVFSHVKKKERYRKFINVLQDKMDKPVSTSKPKNIGNKYTLLEQIAKLKEQGILTEDEFAREKEKILND